MSGILRPRIHLAFITSAAVILAITSGAKIASTFGSARVLAATEPLTGLPYRSFLLTVGALELGIVGVCVSRVSVHIKIGLIAMLATCMVMYRFGLTLNDWHGHCACLGRLTDSLPLDAGTIENLLIGILCYLVLGSYYLLYDAVHRARGASKSSRAAAGASARF